MQSWICEASIWGPLHPNACPTTGWQPNHPTRQKHHANMRVVTGRLGGNVEIPGPQVRPALHGGHGTVRMLHHRGPCEEARPAGYVNQQRQTVLEQ